jgi:predicted short-subunit dehydrogenase-like oxidoreductase (DUF2520 family)
MLSPETAPSLTITIIGSGSVATHLSGAFEKAGHRVPTVYSRQKENAQMLAAKLQAATPTDSLDFTLYPKTDIYLVCLADAAVPEVVQTATFPPGSVVVHTSGSLPVTVIQNSAISQIGVFYPIQSFNISQPVNLGRYSLVISPIIYWVSAAKY